MGIFDNAKAALVGNKAYRAHIAANDLSDKGKPDEAKAKYTEALALYEESAKLGIAVPRILLGFTLLLMREGDFDKAKELLQRISKMKNLTDDDWSQLRMQYSICQWKQGEVDKAVETIKRAGAKKMSGSIYSTLGMFLIDQAKQTGDFAEAERFNLEAMDYDDEDAATLDNMAQMHEAMAEAAAARGDEADAADHLAKAKDFYKKAYKIKPRQITTIYYLARLFHREGDDVRARKVTSAVDTLYFSAICPVTKPMMAALVAEIG